jgi:hypothetical protein
MSIDRDALSDEFRMFGEVYSRNSSRLYEHLSLAIADDEEMLALAARSAAVHPRGGLFFGGVHYLLLHRPADPLAAYYPSMTASAGDPAKAYPAFRAFCLAHADALVEVLANRRVQTNEVRRCAYLLPAFSLVAAQANAPLALIEIGTSAGLNLLWDRYRYTYRHRDSHHEVGDPTSPVHLESRIDGDRAPRFPITIPAVIWRRGIDLNVIDLRDEADLGWLRALIWPEHHERLALLDAAAAILQRDPPTLIEGDALSVLPSVAADAPPEAALVLFHTHTLNQFSWEDKQALEEIIGGLSQNRDVYRIANDLGNDEGPGFKLQLMTYRKGVKESRAVAYCDAHGRWFEWMDDVRPPDEVHRPRE